MKSDQIIALDQMVRRVNEICEKKNWTKDWSNGGCYLHLEVSEFIEALRGKGTDGPEEEAADVLFTLFAVMGHYNIKFSEIAKILDRNVVEREQELGIA